MLNFYSLSEAFIPLCLHVTLQNTYFFQFNILLTKSNYEESRWFSVLMKYAPAHLPMLCGGGGGRVVNLELIPK